MSEASQYLPSSIDSERLSANARKSSHASNAALTAVANVLLAAMGMISGILAARLLGPTGRGELSAIQTWPLFLATIAAFGMPEAIVFYSAQDEGSAGSNLMSSIACALALSVPLIAVGYLLMPFLLRVQSPNVIAAGRWYLLILPVLSTEGMLPHALRGVSDFRAWNLMRLMPLPVGIIVLLTAWGSARDTAIFVAQGFLVGQALLTIPFAALVGRRVPGPFTPDPQRLTPMLRYGLPCMMTGVPQILNLRMDQMLMAAVLPPRDLGLYVIAVAWSGAVSPIVNAAGAVTMPAIASLSDRQFAAQRLCRAVRMTTSLAALLSLVMAAAAPIAIVFLFGSAFRESIPSALVLVPAMGVLGINYALQEGIRGLGYPYEVLRAELIGLASTAIGLAAMLSTLGIFGAALASLLGYSTVTASLIASACNTTGVSTTDLLVPRIGEIRAGVIRVAALARSSIAPA
jgi:O-antigen/teichoic acid export membrane protein